MRTVLYTACFGDHDQPASLSLDAFGSDVNRICFTDSPTLGNTLKGWDIFRRRARFKTARMDAKWYKMSAAHLFPDHDCSIYVDSSVRFHKTDGFVEHAIGALGDHPLAFFRHPEDPARTLRQEAEFSLTMGKYIGEPLLEQVRHYYEAGYRDDMTLVDGRTPSRQALLAGGCIVRLHGPDDDDPYPVARFEKAWFDECVHWSAQDQLSLPYVLWRERIGYGVLPGSIYENEFFSRVWSGPER